VEPEKGPTKPEGKILPGWKVFSLGRKGKVFRIKNLGIIYKLGQFIFGQKP
jgi:hypothetical protein